MLNYGMFFPILYQPESEPILREAFDGWQTGDGIFNHLSQLTDLPWHENTNITDATLDLEYFGNHSGGKFCSPIVKYLLDDDESLSSASRDALARVLIAKYLTNWQRLYATMLAEYNPIHNYDMVETKETETTEDKSMSGNGSSTQGGSVTDAYGETQTTSHGRGEQETTYHYGMNNTEPLDKPSDDVVMQENGTTVIAHGGQDTHTRQLTDSSTGTVTEDNSGTENYELHRSGNIGVTTSQQMLQSERELWTWNYFDQIFKDLDSELGLMYQDPCRV